MSSGAARWLISGRVQGVGFRWFVARHAEEAGLCGWVRNLPDGRVEVAAVGDQEAVQALGERLKAGPRSAIVERVEKIDTPHDIMGLKSFDIR